MKYVDIHCHLDFPDYDADREGILARMRENEIGAIAIDASLEGSKRAVEIAEANENIWATIGIHPEDKLFLFDEKEFERLVKNPKVVGIGECGLDYFRLNKDPASAELQRGKQKKLFESQIQFAIKHDKPLMIHCRDAYDDMLDILGNYKKEAGEKLRGNIHFFAGDVSVAKNFLDLGFTMSFTGVITFLPRRSSAKAGADLYEVIRYIPQNSIMSETDAPFVAPVPYRGKRNEPAYVIEVVKKLAEIREENVDILNIAIIENFKRVFAFYT
jgi:TatD DNase family protein